MTKWKAFRLAATTVAGVLLLGGVALQAQPQDVPGANPPEAAGNPGAQGQGGADRPAAPQPVNFSGKVTGFNLNHEGRPESIMLNTGDKTVQLNFPPQAAAALTAKVAVGDSIQATAIAPPPMRRLLPPPPPPGGGDNGPPPPPPPPDGGDNGDNGPPPPPPDAPPPPPDGGGNGQDGLPPPPPPPDGGAAPGSGDSGGPPDGVQGSNQPKPDHEVYNLVKLTDAKGNVINMPTPETRKAVHVEGIIQSLNYDRRGQVNGVVLQTGELVRIPPRQAGMLKLAAGGKVAVDGMTEPPLDGRQMIYAQKINGAEVKGQQGPREPGNPGAGAGGGKNAPPDRQP